MKKRTYKLLAVLAIGIIAIASCKKKNNTPAIVGKWKITQDATDLNGNGIMDASEVIIDTTNAYYTFSSDGTGSASDPTITLPYTWKMLSGNWVSLNATGFATTILHIDNISATSLTLKDTSGGVASWTIFSRQ